MKVVLEKPTVDAVRKAVQEFDSWDDNPDPALTVLFTQYPENTNLDHVLLKVVALNAFYSTQIRVTSDLTPTIYDVARNIFNLKIDSALSQGDEEIVERIANVTAGGKHQRNYSFATKYCNWQMQDLFPIYDSRVDECLWHLLDRGWIEPFHRQDLYYSYPKLKDVAIKFRDSFGPGKFSFKEIDKFLFVEGGKLLEVKEKEKQAASAIESQQNQAELNEDENSKPELIDEENPEWTDEMFAKAVPFSGLPAELQALLSEEKHVVPDAETPSTRQPAA